MLTRAGLLALHRARRQMRPSASQVPIFFALNRFGFRFDGRHNLAGSVLISKSACVQRQVEELTVHVDEILRNMQSTPQKVEGVRLRSLRVRMGMAGCLIACSCGNQRVFLPELPPDRRAGHTWAVRDLRLRCCNASASLSPDPFGGGRLLHQGEESAA
jgi:hypothetical protein